MSYREVGGWSQVLTSYNPPGSPGREGGGCVGQVGGTLRPAGQSKGTCLPAPCRAPPSPASQRWSRARGQPSVTPEARCCPGHQGSGHRQDRSVPSHLTGRETGACTLDESLTRPFAAALGEPCSSPH